MPIPTHIPQLDDALGGGLPDTGLVLLGGLVCSGQQALATHMAVRCARETGRPVHHWLWRDGGWDDGTLESRARARMIASHIGAPVWDVLRYELDATQLDALKAAVLDLRSVPLQLRTDSWSFDPIQPSHIQAAIEPGSIHVLDRIDRVHSEIPPAPQRQLIADILAATALERGALIVAVANCVWPTEQDYPPDPCPIAHWTELQARADLTLLAGPTPSQRRDGLRIRIEQGGQVAKVWCDLEPGSGRVGTLATTTRD